MAFFSSVGSSPANLRAIPNSVVHWSASKRTWFPRWSRRWTRSRRSIRVSSSRGISKRSGSRDGRDFVVHVEPFQSFVHFGDQSDDVIQRRLVSPSENEIVHSHRFLEPDGAH